MPDSHQQKVQSVATRIVALRNQKIPIRVYHSTTTTTRTERFKKDEVVDISALNRVLHIDPAKPSALVEPNVAMDELVQATAKHGLIPPVIPEFPGVTVGGAIAGDSGQSSSFKFGVFHNTVLSYELVLGSGEVITASPSENADLFHNISGSCGSLAIITAIEVSLVPATKYVRIDYIPTRNTPQLLEKLLVAAQMESIDFIDAIQFENETGVIMLGWRTDERRGLPIRRTTEFHNDWFYRHALNMLTRGGGDVVPLYDYVFRYDRGAYWMGNFAFNEVHLPNTRLTRLMFAPILKTRVMSRILQESHMGQEYLLQDIHLPLESVTEFLEYVARELAVSPIWFLPVAAKGFAHTKIKSALGFIMNIGIWSQTKLKKDQFIAKNIALEKEVVRLGGTKALYGHFYLDEPLFWQNLNHAKYTELRQKYHAEGAFPTTYEKIIVREHYKRTLFKGIIRALRPRWKLPLS